MSARVTVCVLLYGDYPTLAKRCIESILQAAWFDDVNIVVGLNAVAQVTKDYVYSTLGEYSRAVIVESDSNLRKYPMMREMFYGIGEAAKSDYIMWFDDDTFLISGSVSRQASWLSTLVGQLGTSPGLLGRAYTIPWLGQQREWVKSQPWYNSSTGTAPGKVSFIQGSWWLIQTAVLHKLDYPWLNLSHNGGDSMLGEACRHAGIKLINYTAGGVAVNADAAGAESAAPRRGVSEPQIGRNSAAASLDQATTLLHPSDQLFSVGEHGLQYSPYSP